MYVKRKHLKHVKFVCMTIERRCGVLGKKLRKALPRLGLSNPFDYFWIWYVTILYFTVKLPMWLGRMDINMDIKNGD